MCFINRHMSNDDIVNQMYNELVKLHQLGFTASITEVSEPVDKYYLNIDNSPIQIWMEKESQRGSSIHEGNKFRILTVIISWEHILIKKLNFVIGIYFYSIKNHKYRGITSQLRTGSYNLAIEYGKFTGSKTKIEYRNCPICHVFVISYGMYH